MASAKKKQDEKNLKSLRELVSLPGNKECFDCNQRGPTYANMTIGSFVCTTCSGMLRGLTPPHRVKSISMATFTQEEIDFLKERGNDYCRPIWLGLMPQNAQPQSNKDEQKMKDFMSAKYELKRFYLDPNMANQLTNNHKLSRQNAVKYKVQGNDKNFNTLKSPPSKSSLLSLPNSFASNNSNTINQKSKDAVELINSNNVDFIADFSKVPEPCPLSIPISKFNNIQPIVPQPSFANFDNNPIFDSSKSLSNVNQTNPSNFLNNTNGVINSPPPSEDRYAALKDLDCMMKQATLRDDSKITNNVANASWSTFDQSNNSSFISNPFATEDLWQPSFNNVINNNLNNSNNNNFQNNDVFSINPANPFRQAQVSIFNNDFNWFGTESQNLENSSSSHLSPFSNKSWQSSVSGFKANPFAVGSGLGDISRNSNNPFL